MGKIRKKVTPLVLAANRANSAKSTGPRTDLGRRRASRNAGKYYVFGQVTPERMRELNEDPAEFEKLHWSLCSEIQPRGGFEEMLVEEMAVNRWRLARLRRAEAAMLVNRRQRMELRFKYPELGADAGLDALKMESLGLAGVTDSPKKHFQILELLKSLKDKVEREGFTPHGVKILREVYGYCPTAAGAELIRQFEEGLENSKAKGTPDEYSAALPQGEMDRGATESPREAFVGALSREIEVYTSNYDVQLRLRAYPIPASQFEELLVLPEEDSARLTRYEVMLQKELERLQNQLLGWRERRQESTG